jgi:hypothetical protein
MELTGHGGEVFACRFDDTGNYIVSASFERTNPVESFLKLQFYGIRIEIVRIMD